MSRMYVRGVTLVLAVALAACGGSEPASGPEWGNYAPGLRAQLDALTRDADCPALQEQFDNADANGSVDLMRYIDEAMRFAGCY